MPSLRELLALLNKIASQHHGVSIGEQCAREMEAAIRKTWPAERVYISPPDSKKDPARASAMRAAAKRLPTGVAAERFGVSRQYIHKITKK